MGFIRNLESEILNLPLPACRSQKPSREAPKYPALRDHGAHPISVNLTLGAEGGKLAPFP
jgi:hypothetical protein